MIRFVNHISAPGLKILQLCKKFPYPLKDGEQIAINALTHAFSKQGCEVTVLAINTPKHFFDPLQLPVSVRQQAEYHSVFVDTGINVMKAFVNLFNDESYNISRFYSRKVEEKLTELLTSASYDVIQCEGIYLATYLPVIRKYCEAKVVLRAHNVEYKLWEQQAVTAGGWKKRYFSFLAERMKKFELAQLNLFDAIVPISNEDAKQFHEMGGKIPSEVIPVGLEMKEYLVNHEIEEYPSLFHIGSMDWTPNIEGVNWFLDNCWGIIHSRFPSLKLYLAGRNFPVHNKWIQYPNVEIVGEVPDAKEFMKSKGIMIVPLQHGSGMRIKIAEAMALGRAIISTGIGAEGIGVTNDENILLADSPSEFINAIEALIGSKEKYRDLGVQARTFAETHFDNARLTKQLLEFYTQL